MVIIFDCPQCGGKMQAPEDLAGKKAKCPACLAVVDVQGGPMAAPIHASPDSTEVRRPCPVCGEMIIATAAKCRFCGEIFDPTLRRNSAGPDTRKKFKQQMTALGALWIIMACFGMFAVVSLFSLNAAMNQRDQTASMIKCGMMLFIVLLWFTAGIGTCAKRIWAVYLGLTLSYINLLGSIAVITLSGKKHEGPNFCGMMIGILMMIVGIVQGHRCIGFNNKLKNSSLPSVDS